MMKKTKKVAVSKAKKPMKGKMPMAKKGMMMKGAKKK